MALNADDLIKVVVDTRALCGNSSNKIVGLENDPITMPCTYLKKTLKKRNQGHYLGIAFRKKI